MEPTRPWSKHASEFWEDHGIEPEKISEYGVYLCNLLLSDKYYREGDNGEPVRLMDEYLDARVHTPEYATRKEHGGSDREDTADFFNMLARRPA